MNARIGDTVRIHFVARLEDGTVFESSAGREPLQFTLGAGEVLPGLERAVVGMHPGEQKTITIPPEEAYGPHLQEKVIPISRDQFPDELVPRVGQQVQIRREDGSISLATITQVTEESVVLDTNHPLAGKELTFDLTLVEIL